MIEDFGFNFKWDKKSAMLPELIKEAFARWAVSTEALMVGFKLYNELDVRDCWNCPKSCDEDPDCLIQDFIDNIFENVKIPPSFEKATKYSYAVYWLLDAPIETGTIKTIEELLNFAVVKIGIDPKYRPHLKPVFISARELVNLEYTKNYLSMNQ